VYPVSATLSLFFPSRLLPFFSISLSLPCPAGQYPLHSIIPLSVVSCRVGHARLNLILMTSPLLALATK
jgi:hypothetical protein